MEKWKIGVIVALIAGLAGFGVYQQSADGRVDNPSGVTPTSSPTPSPYLGKVIGSSQLPEWNNITTWMNTPKPVKLESLKGSIALVEVFRIQCPHCQDAAPLMQKLYARYTPRGLKLATIQSPGQFNDTSNPENKWSAVQTWATERGLKYPIGFDDKSVWFQGKVKGEYYPLVMVFDKSGKVVLSFNGHDNEKFINLIVTLEKLLAGNTPVAQRSKDTAKWLLTTLQGPESVKDPVLQKAMADDLAQRMK